MARWLGVVFVVGICCAATDAKKDVMDDIRSASVEEENEKEDLTARLDAAEKKSLIALQKSMAALGMPKESAK